MKHLRKSQSKSSEAVAPIAAPEPKDVWTETLAQSTNVNDLAVLELGESTEFSRSCWIAAIQDFAAGSPAEQLDVFELERQIMEAESQVPEIPCDSTACTSNLAASGHGAEFEQVNAREVENPLSDNAADSDLIPVEPDWRKEFEAAKAGASTLKSFLDEATERIKRRDHDLEVLQQDRDQLAAQLRSEQESSAQAAHEAAEVKSRLDGLTAEFELVSAEAAQLRSDRERADSEGNEQLDATKTSAQKLEADGTAAAERIMCLESELERACCARDQLAVQLKSEQESSAQAAHEVAEVKSRLDVLTAEFELISAEAAQLRSDRERADSEWNEQFDATKTSAQKLEAALTQATELNHRFEGEVASLRQERDELHAKLAATQRQAKKGESRASNVQPQMVEEVERLPKKKEKDKGTVPIAPEVLRGDLYTFKTTGKASRTSTQPRRSKRTVAKPT